jgi:uncharacterized membrane protein
MFRKIKTHLVRCFVTGIVALLPMAGLLFSFVYFENLIAGSWLKERGFYFFGLGIILLVATLYFVGLLLSSVIGKWVFNRFDRLLDRLPILGELYQTVKQLVGYGEGPSGLFKRVVWVAHENPDRWELGLVTDQSGVSLEGRVAVYLPNAPTPTSGRLVYLRHDQLHPTDMKVNEAMQLLVSLGAVAPEARSV